jgi:hypothetical protein
MMLLLTVLAAAQKVHKVPKGGEGVKSGPIGLAMILLLCIAVYFLFKSMSKHLKRVREDFPQDEPVRDGQPTATGPQPAPPAAPERPTSTPGGDGST